MPATRTIQLGARAVTVRELTVADVRELLITSPRQADPLHALAFDEFGLQDLSCQCDATPDDLEQFAPSDLQPLVDACRDLNPHFFRVRAALSGVARLMLAEAERIASTDPVLP
jgi:hypothetical protein